jgi:hypothetical protein
MAIAASNLTKGTIVAALAGTYASITPSTQNLVLLTVASRLAASIPAQPTVTGNSLTWVAIVSNAYTSKRRMTVFRAMGTPTSGAGTISFGAEVETDVTWNIDQLSGIDTTGGNGAGAIVQSGTFLDGSGTATAGTMSLSAFSNVNNATYASFGNTGTSVPTAKAGFTLLGSALSANNLQTTTEFLASNDVHPSMSYSGADTIYAVGLEIKSADQGAASTYAGFRSLMGVGI